MRRANISTYQQRLICHFSSNSSVNAVKGFVGTFSSEPDIGAAVRAVRDRPIGVGLSCAVDGEDIVGMTRIIYGKHRQLIELFTLNPRRYKPYLVELASVIWAPSTVIWVAMKR
jgi:hypothetical protein